MVVPVLSEYLAWGEKSAQSHVMTEITKLQKEFFSALGGYHSNDALFDRISDTVYFLKDGDGRYISVNQSLVERCGCNSKLDILGRTASEVFPAPLGDLITQQDDHVIKLGTPIQAKLELHLYAQTREGWCLTWKESLRNQKGVVIGLSGISRDLQPNLGLPFDISELSNVLTFVDENIDQTLRLPELARIAGLSGYQLDKRIHALFGLSAGQYITRARIEHACNLLKQSMAPISTIALDCGYSDQAAFSRQFRRSLGLSPAAYRKTSNAPIKNHC